MFFWRTKFALGVQTLECLDQIPARLGRLYDVIHQPSARGDKRICKGISIQVDQLLAALLPVFCRVNFSAEHDLGGAFCTHNGYFRGRPRYHAVGPQILATHGNVRTAVGVAQHDRQLRHRGSRVGEQYLRTVTNNSTVLLVNSRQKSRNINESQQRDAKRITKAYKPGHLIGSVDVQHSRHDRGLTCHDTDGPSLKPSKPNDNICGKTRLQLKKILVIKNSLDHLSNVIANFGFDWDQSVQLRIVFNRTLAWHSRWIFEVVRRQEAQQATTECHRALVVLCDEVHHPRAVHLRRRTTQLVGRDYFAGDLFYDLRPSDKHLGISGLDNKICEGRAVRSAAGARATNNRHLRHRT